MDVQKTLFFELLNKGRELKRLAASQKLAYLEGYRAALKRHLEEIKIADRVIDYWKCQNAGTVDYRA